MTKDEALRFALEALEAHADIGIKSDKAINAIKEALAQPEQDWRNAALRIGEDLSSVGPDGYYNMTAQQWLDWAMEQKPRGNNSLAQPEQEPVEWPHKYGCRANAFGKCDMGCTIPPQRTWVGLTDWEINSVANNNNPLNGIRTFARAIEAKLKEKNT